MFLFMGEGGALTCWPPSPRMTLTGSSDVQPYSADVTASAELTLLVNPAHHLRALVEVDLLAHEHRLHVVDRLPESVLSRGETPRGAVVSALEIGALRIGPEIDPGVPWTEALGESGIALALKSGNFGAVDFFERALGSAP